MGSERLPGFCLADGVWSGTGFHIRFEFNHHLRGKKANEGKLVGAEDAAVQPITDPSFLRPTEEGRPFAEARPPVQPSTPEQYPDEQ